MHWGEEDTRCGCTIEVEVLDSVQFRLLDTGKGGERARCGCCIEEKLCTAQIGRKGGGTGKTLQARIGKWV
jgi:hypothetical protein